MIFWVILEQWKRQLTMNLLNRANVAEEKLGHLLDAYTNVDEISQLEQLSNLLNALVNNSRKVAENATSLSVNKLRLNNLVGLDEIKSATEVLANKFKDTPKSSTIFDGRKWTTFYDKINTFIKNSALSVEKDWAQHFNALFGGRTPEQRRQTLIISIPENKIAIDKYTKLYKEFTEYKPLIPRSEDDFLRLNKLIVELSEIEKSFKEDIPANIKEFFNQTSLGASLDYLTDDVMAWLRENNMMSSFVVHAKR